MNKGLGLFVMGLLYRATQGHQGGLERMTLAFWAVEVLGIAARSSYMQHELFSDMPSSTEVEGGGVGAADMQTTGGRSAQ